MKLKSSTSRRGFLRERHPRLIAGGAVMREHQLAFLEVIHRDHLVRRARKQRFHHRVVGGGGAKEDGRSRAFFAIANSPAPFAGEAFQSFKGSLGGRGLVAGARGQADQASREGSGPFRNGAFLSWRI